jgi:hypothetical protein
MAKKNSDRAWRVFVVTLVCTGVAAMLGLATALFGSVSGTEFSPTHFESRRFTVHEIPWLQIQISPIRRTQSQSATARYLIGQSLVQRAPGPPQEWHVVELSRGGLGYAEADAKLLTDQLELHVYRHNASTTSSEFWHNWSIEQPAKAKVLWPVIQKMAVRELYILMPKLFSLAVDAQDDIVLQQDIDAYLRGSYAELIAEMRNNHRRELAAQLLAEALNDYPDDARLRSLQ